MDVRIFTIQETMRIDLYWKRMSFKLCQPDFFALLIKPFLPSNCWVKITFSKYFLSLPQNLVFIEKRRD